MSQLSSLSLRRRGRAWPYRPNRGCLRASGLSTVYSVVVAVFSGFSPFVLTWLVHETGDKLAPAWYLVAVTVVSTLVMPWLVDRTGEDLDAQSPKEAPPRVRPAMPVGSFK